MGRFTDEELLSSVTKHLQQFIDSGNHSMAWAMGATWARRDLLMGAVLSNIRRMKDAPDGIPTDEELAERVASGLRHDGLVMGLEMVAQDREQREFRQRVEERYAREKAERDADPAKAAEWKAQQEEWRLRMVMEKVKEQVASGDPGDGPQLREMLKELRADGAGHHMAVSQLEAEDAERRHRVRLVRAWLLERVPADACPPWAEREFEEEGGNVGTPSAG